MITPLGASEVYCVFKNIMVNRAFAPWSKCSFLHNIFKSIQTLLIVFNILQSGLKIGNVVMI